VETIDFDNSYMTFFGRDEGNIARIRLDAACTLIDERSGEGEVFYLIAPCRAERMYRDGALFQLPSYEFCGIFASLGLRRWRLRRERPGERAIESGGVEKFLVGIPADARGILRHVL
jgi:hypothetical protein